MLMVNKQNTYDLLFRNINIFDLILLYFTEKCNNLCIALSTTNTKAHKCKCAIFNLT